MIKKIINSLDFKDNPWQFFCGDCNKIIKPQSLKPHLSKKHGIDIKNSDKEFVNAMLDIYYFIIMPIGDIKKSLFLEEKKDDE